MDNDKSNFDTEEVQGKLFPVVKRKRGQSRINVCPFCEKSHSHGEGEGHCYSHCIERYFEKIMIRGQEFLQKDGYVIRDVD